MAFENCRACFFDNSLNAKIASCEWFFNKELNLALDEFENLAAAAKVCFLFEVIIKIIYMIATEVRRPNEIVFPVIQFVN